MDTTPLLNLGPLAQLLLLATLLALGPLAWVWWRGGGRKITAGQTARAHRVGVVFDL